MPAIPAGTANAAPMNCSDVVSFSICTIDPCHPNIDPEYHLDIAVGRIDMQHGSLGKCAAGVTAAP